MYRESERLVHLSAGRNENVCAFDVSVDDALLVEEVESLKNLKQQG